MDVLTHLLVAVLALAAARVPWGRVAFAAPFAVLPDLDGAWGVHRALAHSVPALVAVALAVYLGARLARAGSPAGLAGLAAFSFSTHLLVDLPTGVALAYPFTLAAPFWSLQAFHDFALGPLHLDWVLEAGVLPAPPAADGPIGLARPVGSSVRAVASFSVMATLVALLAQLAFNPAFARAAAGVRAAIRARVRAPEGSE